MAEIDLANIRKSLGQMMPTFNESYGVGQLWIVGSRARGDHRPNSDLDIMVEFERRGISLLGFCRLEHQMSEALGVTVDLVERGAMYPQVQETVDRDAIPV